MMVSKLNALFSIRTDSRVKKLLGWKQGDEEEKWAEQAINTLVKKLKKQTGAIEDLEQALTTPTAPSKCVTIPRSLDGRLQVSHRKSHPHVIYCRVWRWPDLKSSLELRGLPCCQFPFSSKNPAIMDKVCINPYHYERIESTVKLPPVIVTPRRENPCCSNTVFATENIFPLPNFAALSMYPKVGTVVIDGENSTIPPPYSLQPPPGHGVKIEQEDAFNFAAMSENSVKVPFQEVEHWATILYYELCCRVGDQYHCKNNVITIDGFTNPSTEKGRFCLGVLPNLNRNSTIELTRRNIGRGVRLTFIDGGVFAECLSECAVFFQSKICNYLHGFHPNTIFKIQPGGCLQIFDFGVFQKVLQEKVGLGFDAVYDLVRICSIRMSFVKGWGAEYHRLEVTSTPCWIEIHLHGPLRWLDRVLVEMGSPNYRISSVS